MGAAIVGIKFDGALEFSFCGSPIPFVPIIFNGKHDVCVRVGFIQGRGLFGGGAGFGG
jgi:hypothetical protein